MKHDVDKNPNKIPLPSNGLLDINMRNLANRVTATPVWQGGLQALATVWMKKPMLGKWNEEEEKGSTNSPESLQGDAFVDPENIQYQLGWCYSG